jgi:hypothetical protein
VYALLLGRKYKQAETIKKDLRISDKKFWWLKVRALAYNKDWAELDRFSKVRKSPIGYEVCKDMICNSSLFNTKEIMAKTCHRSHLWKSAWRKAQ